MDISSMLEVQVKEVKAELDVKENDEHSASNDNVSSSRTSSGPIQPIPVSQEEENYYQITFGNDISSVRFRRIHCTACDAHIGSAPSQVHNMLEHPVLRTLLCASCWEFYGDGKFEQGDDATDMFCRWCANGGNLYCCSYCSNTFCSKCIKRNFASLVRKKIEADERWQCFVCNPSDLYESRALCWALLQHVQTVTSILQNSKTMSEEEVEDKMSLDESECCPRRTKRKQKRRLSSEEEDETYIPKINGSPVTFKRKIYKKPKSRYNAPNGMMKQVLMQTSIRSSYSSCIPIKPKPFSLPGSLRESESTLRQQEQSPNIERQETVQPKLSENIVVSPSSTMTNIDPSVPLRYNSTSTSSSLYHTTLMNQTSASTTYIRPPIMKSFHKIILPSLPLTQLQNCQASQSLRNSANAMVSISKSNSTDDRYRPQLIFPKGRKSDVTLTPNIIELDSDSDDEPKVVDQRADTTSDDTVNNGEIVSDKIIPVALFSAGNDNSTVNENKPLKEMSATVKKQSTFNEIMLTHNQDLDTFLGKIRQSMHNFLTVPSHESNKSDKSETYQKIKRFHENIRETVFQLAHINDRVIREYNKWERSRKNETDTLSTNQNATTPRENVDIPLNMTCVNESDTDQSDYEESECRIMEPSDNIVSSNVLKDLLLFKKDMQHRGVGDSAISSADKAIQVYDVVSRDYEKCMGYSRLTKTHYDEETVSEKESVLESVEISEDFDYQEQFIFYLQHIEDHGIDMEDRGLEEPSEALEESPAADSSSESRQDISQSVDVSIASVEHSKNGDQEECSKNSVSCVTNDKTDVLKNSKDCELTIIPRINDDFNSTIPITDIRGVEIPKIVLKTFQNGAATLNNDNTSSSENLGEPTNTETGKEENEEDCTIIND